jgi:hypothetical protein
MLGRLQLRGMAGRNNRCIWSGTGKYRLVCHPARLSTSTISLRGPAPTARANAASSASKRGMETLVVRSRPGDGLLQFLLQLDRGGRTPGGRMLPIVHAGRPVFVVAASNLANPIAGVASATPGVKRGHTDTLGMLAPGL